MSPFPSVEDLISQLLNLICDQDDPERAFVKFVEDDDTVLLINNYGGLSNLELGALTQETLAQLGKAKWEKITECAMLKYTRKKLAYQANKDLRSSI